MRAAAAPHTFSPDRADVFSSGADTALFNLVCLMGNFAFGAVITTAVGRALARGDKARAGRDLATAMIMALAWGLASALAFFTLKDVIFRAIGLEPELWSDATAYLFTRAPAGPATMLMVVAQGAYRGIMNMYIPLSVVVVIGLINLVLDPLMIFTLGWGIAGAGIATAIAQWCGALIFIGMM